MQNFNFPHDILSKILNSPSHIDSDNDSLSKSLEKSNQFNLNDSNDLSFPSNYLENHNTNDKTLSKKTKREEINNTKKKINNEKIEKENKKKKLVIKNDLNKNFEKSNDKNDLNNNELKNQILEEKKVENKEKIKLENNNNFIIYEEKEKEKKELKKKESIESIIFKKEKNIIKEKEEKEEVENEEEKEKENNNNKYKHFIKFGRKTQKEKDKGNKGNHTRDSEDNKIRKIKSFFGKSLYFFLKNNLSGYELLKLDISINKDLKKEFNENLLNRTIKDIYMNSKISEKYRHYDPNTNKILINKIYNEKNEISVIKILNLTYREVFEIFIRKIKNNKINPELKEKIKGTNILDNNKFKDIESMINKIKEDEKNKNGNIYQYIKDIKSLCINFENWFGKKIGRNR